MKTSILAAALLATTLTSFEAAAQQPARVQVGTLTCRLAPSVGLIVASRQRMECQFAKQQGGRERYSGVATRIGLDLGVTTGGVMVWGVFASTQRLGRGVLAGNYVGASGDIALGVGIGANALIGGSRRSVMLQPLSVSGQVGVNLALGVAGLELRLR
ncbi:MAG: DUF992 domain-containing protein [Hyphomicrobiales bacterium]|nr:DUF992 domain-containing protein [Hyphomicrobiales bacterium]